MIHVPVERNPHVEQVQYLEAGRNRALELSRAESDFNTRRVQEAYTYALLNERFYTALIRQLPEFNNKVASAVKRLTDFNGFEYVLVESKPRGYIIFDQALTAPLLANPDAVSPYFGLYHNLIFGGVANYLFKPQIQPRGNNTLFVHTILGSDIFVDEEQMQLLREDSMYRQNIIERESAQSLISPFFLVQNQFIHVSHAYYIRDMITSGFNTTRNCGYVAAAMLVRYWANRRGVPQLMQGFSWNRNLVLAIQNGRVDSSWGSCVDSALTDWSIARGINNMPGRHWFVPTSNYIFTRVQNDRPVILFGMLPDVEKEKSNATVAHAVVVHAAGRTVTLGIPGGHFFHVHYGWGNQHRNVRITPGVLGRGSIAYFRERGA